MGIVAPLASNYIPIRQALGANLRDALDRFREGVDDMQVEMIKME